MMNYTPADYIFIEKPIKGLQRLTLPPGLPVPLLTWAPRCLHPGHAAASMMVMHLPLRWLLNCFDKTVMLPSYTFKITCGFLP